jgi:predicted nucleic acid-binding protein
MSNEIIVLDANVAVKMLHAEADTEKARAFFRACTERDVKLLVPQHFLYEIVNVCQRVNVGVDEVLEFYDTLKASILTVVSPGRDTWLRAEEIVLDGHPNSGFPSIYDSIYHAMALAEGGVFVTADKRHVVKTHQHGGVILLSEWYASQKT